MKFWILFAATLSLTLTAFQVLEVILGAGRRLDSSILLKDEYREYETEEEGEIVELKLMTRKRGRRATARNKFLVIQVSKLGFEKPLNMHLARKFDILSPHFTVAVNDEGLQRRRKRSDDMTLIKDLQHSMYVGHVLSEDDNDIGWITVSCLEENESLQMIGMVEINGTTHEITPLYNLDDPVDPIETAKDIPAVQHVLRPVRRQPGRTCDLRKLPQQHRANSTIVASPMAYKEEPPVAVQFQQRNPQIARATSMRTLELAVFTDPKFMSQMNRRFPKDTLKNAIAYTLALVSNLNLLYKNPTLEGNYIDIRLNHMEMMTKNIKSLKTAKGREDIYLGSFCTFQANKNMKKHGWDHAMMLSGFDLRGTTGSGVIGVAYTGAMCDPVYSCSLIEAANFLGAYTMAHELGHSLGMPHDGEDSSSSCDPNKYIMAAYESAGQIDWSSCSARNLDEFLRGRSAMPDASYPGCLRTSMKRKRGSNKPIKYAKKRLPGEIFDATQQCAMTFGKGASVPNTSKTSICKELTCGNGTNTIGIQPALEGTACGTNMWCRNGSCVKKRARRS